MKKTTLLVFIPFVLASCYNQTNNNQQLQVRIDSLEKKLDNTYKPGLGEFMGSIQTHHAKLWFAGQNQNWKLANFEINEIKEALEDIGKYCADRTESKSIGMINGPIDTLTKSIEQKNIQQFKNNYILLTNTCNNCHRQTEHEFNVIIIPTTPPLSNQKF